MTISEELQKPFWDMATVEQDLNTIWQNILFDAQKIQEHDLNLSLEQTKVQAASEVLDGPWIHHAAVVEYFMEKREFVVLKHLCPNEFNQQLKICFGRLEDMCRYGGDDFLYFSLVETFCLMFKELDADEQMELQKNLDPLLESPNLSFTLFLSLVPIASQTAQQQLMSKAIVQWKQDFLTGLQSGDLGRVHDALFWLAHRRFFDLIKEEFSTWHEISPYVEALLSINTIPAVNQCLEVIVRKNYKLRMNNIPKEFASLDSTFYSLLNSIEAEFEMGSALRKLNLLEQAVLKPNDPDLISDAKLILAAENEDLEEIVKTLKARSFLPWECLGNGDTLIGITSQMAVLRQMEGLTLPKVSEEKDNFYIFFHQLVQKMLPQENWALVIDIIKESAFRSNGVFVGKNSSLFFGKWTAPESLYNNLLKVYLPKNELGLWVKYCIDPNSQQLGELMLDAYQGGAETYGLWFHLMQKALINQMHLDCDWQVVCDQLGYYRKLAGLFLNNIQVPLGQKITLAARIQQEDIDKIWPGSPLNFGVPDSEFNASHTTMLNEIRSHYLQKTAALIAKFNQFYSHELKELRSSSGHYNNIGRFDFNGREFLVYPSNEEFSYAITYPFEINGERVTGIHILWSWPASSTFFYSGHIPKKIPNVSIKFNPIWVHPSGVDKCKMNGELSSLFALLCRPIQDEEEFEKQLARFLYLFSQAVCFKRGSASIGLVLLSAILTFQGQRVPDAPPPPFFLDCEAMCTTEEEFSACFINWLLTGDFAGSE